jgi:predicted dehydrogenase
VRILRELGDAELVGFHDASAARAERVVSELGVPSFATLDALVDAADALTIVVPTPAHHAVAKAALDRGKHLLIEKPITATLAEADELLAIAKRTGALVQTGHVERFNRAIRAALPLVDTPRFIESDRLAPFTARGADVAVVLDLMIHDLDLVRTLVRSPVTDLQAVGVPVITPTPDIANARLQFASGAVANITASRVSRERVRKIRIFQQSGYLTLDLAEGKGEFYRLRDDVDVAAIARAFGAGAPAGTPPAPLELTAFVERVPVEAPEGEPLRLELESFIAAVRGAQPVAVTGDDGREALEVALRIVREIERTLPALRGAPRASGVR